MIPMSMPNLQVTGPLPAEANEGLQRMKTAVLAMAAFGVGRLFFSMSLRQMDWGVFNLLMSAIMAVFVLKEDPHFERVYKFLSTTVCQQCAEQGMGGIGCVYPFMLITAMNCVFDVLFRFSSAGSTMPYGLFLIGSIVSEGVAAYFAWIVYKIVRDLSSEEGSGSTEMGYSGGGGFRQMGAPPASAGGGGQARDAPVNAGQGGGEAGGNFVPFGGDGQRLGS